MKKILFLFLMLLCLVSCKEDLSEYDKRIEQRQAANAAMQGKIDALSKHNSEQAKRNADIQAMLERVKLEGDALAAKLDSLEQSLIVPVEPKLLSMEFVSTENSDLTKNIACEIVGDSIIDCWLPAIMHEKYLIPRFTFDGTLVTIDDMEAESGVSMFDFTKPVTVTVHTSESSTSYRMFVHSFTGLPVMYINIDGNQEVTSKDYYLNASFRLVEDVRTRGPGDVVGAPVHIKGRGNTSWGRPKKPYRLKFDEKIALLGEHKDKSWVLIPNYSDKSMLRNAVTFFMGKISNLEWTPGSHFVEVVINGRYDGTYLLAEKIKVSNHRVAVGDDGFILECNRWADRYDDIVYFCPQHVESDMEIKEPEDIQYGDANYNYIVEFMNQADAALFSSNFTDPNEGWQKYLDMDSFVDWYLIHEIALNCDCMFNFSTYFNLKRGDKLKMGPLWDFDIAYGNVKENNNEYIKWVFPYGDLLSQSRWYARLMKDPVFVAKVKERFDYFYSHKNDILMFLNDQASYLHYSVIENENRWGTLYHYTYKNFDIWGSYWNEVQDLKEWINTRFEWMKNNYDKK